LIFSDFSKILKKLKNAKSGTTTPALDTRLGQKPSARKPLQAPAASKTKPAN